MEKYTMLSDVYLHFCDRGFGKITTEAYEHIYNDMGLLATDVRGLIFCGAAGLPVDDLLDLENNKGQPDERNYVRSRGLTEYAEAYATNKMSIKYHRVHIAPWPMCEAEERMVCALISGRQHP